MFQLLFRHLKLILAWGVILALAALVVSLFLPRYYSATSQILIISRDRGGADPYTQAKSAERIGENLAALVGTTDFFSKVMESTYTFDRGRWTGLADRDARRQWHRDIQASMIYNTGLMNLTVYSTSREDTLALAQAATDAMVSRGWEYVGGDVALKAVNNPLVSRLPGRPNYIFNVLAAFVAGVLFSSYWVVRAGARGAQYGRAV